MAFAGECRATGIGSLAMDDPARAVEAVFDACPDLPYWPQLPKLTTREGMTPQALSGFPGLQIVEGRLRHVQDEAFFEGLERLFAAWEAGDASVAALAPEAAAGFEPFIEAVRRRRPRQAKGQIAGPVTVGMAVLGEDGNPILYNDTVRDVLEKFLYLRVKWQAERIAEAGAEPIVFVDEPFMASFGTPFFGWSREQVRAALDPVLAGTPASGSHCCSNTEWSIFLGSPGLDVVSFDAYEFARNFMVYRDDIAAFLTRGGTIAWGLVPTDPEALARETAASLQERLMALLASVEGLGFSTEEVLHQSLITPACGLGTRPPETGERAMALARELSEALKERL